MPTKNTFVHYDLELVDREVAVLQGLGFRVSGFGLGVLGLGFRVWGLGFRAQGLGLRVLENRRH